MTRKRAAPAGPSQDERVLAALSHASAILPFWGAIASIVIWATQKDKSPFVAFQALQAVAYHFVVILLFLLGGICYACSIFAFPLATIFSMPASEGAAEEVSPIVLLPMAIPFALLALMMLAWFVYVGYGLVGAAQTLQGRDFRYALLGRRLESYLQKE